MLEIRFLSEYFSTFPPSSTQLKCSSFMLWSWQKPRTLLELVNISSCKKMCATSKLESLILVATLAAAVELHVMTSWPYNNRYFVVGPLIPSPVSHYNIMISFTFPTTTLVQVLSVYLKIIKSVNKMFETSF